MGDLVDAVERLARSGDSSHTLVPDLPSDQKNT
jgi:hypothetical protein